MRSRVHAALLTPRVTSRLSIRQFGILANRFRTRNLQCAASCSLFPKLLRIPTTLPTPTFLVDSLHPILVSADLCWHVATQRVHVCDVIFAPDGLFA